MTQRSSASGKGSSERFCMQRGMPYDGLMGAELHVCKMLACLLALARRPVVGIRRRHRHEQQLCDFWLLRPHSNPCRRRSSALSSAIGNKQVVRRSCR